MDERTIRLTREIHRFATDQLSWDECIALLEEVVEDREWMNRLFLDMEHYQRFHSEAMENNEVSRPDERFEGLTWLY